MPFPRQILLGLFLGIVTGLFLGDLAQPFKLLADAFVKLLQMSVLPFVILSIVSNVGKLNPSFARQLGLRLGAILALLWGVAISFALLMPLSFPKIESASFYSPLPPLPARAPHFLDQYIPANPFASLANSMVPAVVLISLLFGLALMGTPNKRQLLEVIDPSLATVGRMAKFVVRLTPYGLFAIAAQAAGTLDVEKLARIEVFILGYVVLSLLLSLWILPGLVAALTPVPLREILRQHRDSLLTAFLVADLFIVLPAIMEVCTAMVGRYMAREESDSGLPGTVAPVSFTFPHSGKLLSLSFVLFAGWLTDSSVSALRYPELAFSGLLSFFGSLNTAIPYLLDNHRIPADAFQLFLVTGVVNSRFGTLLAVMHTIAVCLLGSAAMTGALRFRWPSILRYLLLSGLFTASSLIGLRSFFSQLDSLHPDGRQLVYSLRPLHYPPVEDVLSSPALANPANPPANAMLSSIRARRILRVGIIGDGIPFAYRNNSGQLVGFDVEMALRLAEDLGVRPIFIRFRQEELNQYVRERLVDIVITGARLTPERAAEFAVSTPYLHETLAILVLDHRRSEFPSWAALRDHPGLRVGVQNLPYYYSEIKRRLPQARIEIIPESKELLDPQGNFDVYLLPAERGSVLTILNPRYSVVVPEGPAIEMPLAYPIAGEDPSWQRYVDTWIQLKKQDGFITGLYEHWITGRAARSGARRWSILRDVLHWVP